MTQIHFEKYVLYCSFRMRQINFTPLHVSLSSSNSMKKNWNQHYLKWMEVNKKRTQWWETRIPPWYNSVSIMFGKPSENIKTIYFNCLIGLNYPTWWRFHFQQIHTCVSVLNVYFILFHFNLFSLSRSFMVLLFYVIQWGMQYRCIFEVICFFRIYAWIIIFIRRYSVLIFQLTHCIGANIKVFSDTVFTLSKNSNKQICECFLKIFVPRPLT